MSKEYIEWVPVVEKVDEDEVLSVEAGQDESPLTKTAQRRKVWDWLHEKVNVPRKALEYFSSDYETVMKLLRDVDNEIRTKYAQQLRPNYKEAKKALKQRRYLDVIHFLAEFNNALSGLVDSVGLIREWQSEHRDDFYGNEQHFDWERNYFNKEAAAMDVFKSITRPMAGKLMERIYGDSTQRQMQKLVDEAGRLTNLVMQQLQSMGSARARGKVNEYLASIDKIDKSQNKFSKVLRTTYDKEIKPIVERRKAQMGEEALQGRLEGKPEDEADWQRYLESQEGEVSPEDWLKQQQEAEPQPPQPAKPSPEEWFQQYRQEEPFPLQTRKEPMDINLETENAPEPGQELTQEQATRMAQAMRKDEFVDSIMKQAESNPEAVGDILLDYADALERFGYRKESLECVALAEGLLNA